ncbi:hypothetical protein EDB84DRAFT_1561259 [Lactarius hengduanensis]|nr:hypothetical protein EDB84DRAFT_1561259 [Lactarius hengduanensis]
MKLLDLLNVEDPLLASNTDDIGTSTVSRSTRGFTIPSFCTQGIDLVAMSVNSLLVQGVQPFGVTLIPDMAKGIARGRQQAAFGVVKRALPLPQVDLRPRATSFPACVRTALPRVLRLPLRGMAMPPAQRPSAAGSSLPTEIYARHASGSSRPWCTSRAVARGRRKADGRALPLADGRG